MGSDKYRRFNHAFAFSTTPSISARKSSGGFFYAIAAKIDKLHLGQYFDGSGIFFSHFSQIILLCSPYILSFLYSKIHLHNIHILLFPDVFENQYTEFYNKDI